jgi:hypothetical protein
MQQILEKTSEYRISMFDLFVGFKAACDTIWRKKWLEALKKFQIPQKLKRLVKLTLKHVRCRVKMQNNLSEQCETSVGLRQEDTPSCILFNPALEKVIKDSERN